MEKGRRSIDPMIEVIYTKVNQIHETIFGNGQTGLKVKVDRNTMFRKFVIWIVAAMFVAFATAMATGLIKP